MDQKNQSTLAKSFFPASVRLSRDRTKKRYPASVTEPTEEDSMLSVGKLRNSALHSFVESNEVLRVFCRTYYTFTQELNETLRPVPVDNESRPAHIILDLVQGVPYISLQLDDGSPYWRRFWVRPIKSYMTLTLLNDPFRTLCVKFSKPSWLYHEYLGFFLLTDMNISKFVERFNCILLQLRTGSPTCVIPNQWKDTGRFEQWDLEQPELPDSVSAAGSGNSKESKITDNESKNAATKKSQGSITKSKPAVPRKSVRAGTTSGISCGMRMRTRSSGF